MKNFGPKYDVLSHEKAMFTFSLLFLLVRINTWPFMKTTLVLEVNEIASSVASFT